MMMAVKRVKQAVINMLLIQQRKRMRWCVYAHLESVRVENMKCYRRYELAEQFCKDNLAGERSLYKIGTIADVLSKLSGPVKKKKGTLLSIPKEILCKQFPMLSFPASIDYTAAIPIDIFFPVTWHKIINPLTDVCQWVVTWDGQLNTIDFRHEDYATVLAHFMKRTETMIFLEGRDVLKLQALIGDSLSERYVEVFRYYYHRRRQCYMLDKKMDGSKPFLLQVTYFGKYNSSSQRLEFFDEELKKITPGKIIREVDVRYFDTGIFNIVK